MTDSRIPERYLVDRRIVRLTHAQRSSYFMSTLWSVSNRTDGHIQREDLPFIPTFDTDAVPALVKCGLWEETETGWVDVEFLKVQTSSDDLAVLENARAAERRKKNRQNAHKRGDHSRCTPDTCDQVTTSSPSFTHVPGDVPGEDSRGRHRIGQDRKGKDRQGHNNTIVSRDAKTISGEDRGGLVSGHCVTHGFSWPCPEGGPGCRGEESRGYALVDGGWVDESPF